MASTQLAYVLGKPNYQLLAAVSATLMLVVYMLSQVLFVRENLDVWLANIPPVHGALLLVFVGVFGITFAYQVYLWRQPKMCSTSQKMGGGGVSVFGTIGKFFIAQCPACASLGAFFLPVASLSFIGQNTIWLNLLSIGLMVFTLHYLGAFLPEK